jgi:two-component system phosphate regulon response regulator PhoB
MIPTIGLVLVVDDDPDVRSSLRDVLHDAGFLVAEAATGCAAREEFDRQHPDLVLLDLGLPDISGLDVLTELISRSSTPVIVLSGRSGETDRVVGLDLGADDYISKPFGERELIARVNAAIRRRSGRAPHSVMTFGSLVIDHASRDVSVDGEPVVLTPKEFDLLAFLAASPRRVFTRGQLLEQVWGSSARWQDDNTVGEHVYRLRRKLDPDDRSRWIETVRGVGYRFAPGHEGPAVRAGSGAGRAGRGVRRRGR